MGEEGDNKKKNRRKRKRAFFLPKDRLTKDILSKINGNNDSGH